MTKRIEYKNLREYTIYLAQVFGCDSESIFTEDEINEARMNGYIDVHII